MHESDARLRIRDDAMHARIGASRIRRVGRDCYDAGVQTPEERGDVLETRRNEQDDTVARRRILTERGGDGACTIAQRLEREDAVLDPVSAQEAEYDVVRMSGRAIVQQFDERGDSSVARVVLQ